MKYTVKETNEREARAQAVNAPISLKVSVEICNFLKGKTTEKAIAYLKDVEEVKKPIPFKKFNMDRGHKRGMGPGRFPVKAAGVFIKMIQNAVKNAGAKGLSSDLVIKNIIPNKGVVGYHHGNRRGLKTKAVHLQCYIVESAVKSAKATKKVAKEVKSEAKVEKPKATEKTTTKKATTTKETTKVAEKVVKEDVKKVEKPTEDKKETPAEKPVKDEEVKSEVKEWLRENLYPKN